MTIRIGTAGWAIPRLEAANFGEAGSSLKRYAGAFNASEINSTFRKNHKPATFGRWAASVPDEFRFSVKMPKTISHEMKLRNTHDAICAFVDAVHTLGPKAGPWLLQLPPSLAFDAQIATSFFSQLRTEYSGPLVFEPRHASWFEDDVDGLLQQFEVSWVAADPAKVPAAGRTGGSKNLAYFRLHGSPRVYYSSYEHTFLAALADTIRASAAKEIWCIFDNTAAGAATANALSLQLLLRANRQPD